MHGEHRGGDGRIRAGSVHGVEACGGRARAGGGSGAWKAWNTGELCVAGRRGNAVVSESYWAEPESGGGICRGHDGVEGRTAVEGN